MKALRACVIVPILLAAECLHASDTKEFTFDRAQQLSEWKIPVADVSPALPADWPGDGFLVLELRASSSQRLDLRVYSGEAYSRLLLQPYPGVWIRATIPVATIAQPPSSGFDMASVGNRSHIGYYLGLWGPFRAPRGV